VNRWFELNFKRLFKMLEFIQPSRISPEPKIGNYYIRTKKTPKAENHHAGMSSDRIYATTCFV
jgi:hypothetical protein